jgi:hypothetical protein
MAEPETPNDQSLGGLIPDVLALDEPPPVGRGSSSNAEISARPSGRDGEVLITAVWIRETDFDRLVDKLEGAHAVYEFWERTKGWRRILADTGFRIEEVRDGVVRVYGRNETITEVYGIAPQAVRNKISIAKLESAEASLARTEALHGCIIVLSLDVFHEIGSIIERHNHGEQIDWRKEFHVFSERVLLDTAETLSAGEAIAWGSRVLGVPAAAGGLVGVNLFILWLMTPPEGAPPECFPSDSINPNCD